jgi:hypothetical protein
MIYDFLVVSYRSLYGRQVKLQEFASSAADNSLDVSLTFFQMLK